MLSCTQHDDMLIDEPNEPRNEEVERRKKNHFCSIAHTLAPWCVQIKDCVHFSAHRMLNINTARQNWWCCDCSLSFSSYRYYVSFRFRPAIFNKQPANQASRVHIARVYTVYTRCAAGQRGESMIFVFNLLLLLFFSLFKQHLLPFVRFQELVCPQFTTTTVVIYSKQTAREHWTLTHSLFLSLSLRCIHKIIVCIDFYCCSKLYYYSICLFLCFWNFSSYFCCCRRHRRCHCSLPQSLVLNRVGFGLSKFFMLVSFLFFLPETKSVSTLNKRLCVL